MPTFREDPKIGTKVPLIKTADLNDKSVTEKKLADGSITKDKIATGAVTSEKLQHNAVTTETINDRAVTAEKIAEGAVSVDEIKDLAVTNAKIADESVSAEKLQSGLRSTIVSTHDKAIELDKKKANITDVDYALECLENKIGDRVVVEGNVTNLPDDEDLTSVSTIDGREVMRLNDRAYEPSNFSGKGYKILRKNIQRLSLPTTTILVSNIPSSSGSITITINGKTTTVALDVATDTTTTIIATKIGTAIKESLDDYDVSVSSNTIVLTRNNSKYASPSSIDVGNTTAGISVKDSITKSECRNVLTQDMINKPNTVYEIRYDFDLDGESIQMFNNCILTFKGGSFKNGKIIGEHTVIDSLPVLIFNNIDLSGSYICSTSYSEWLGAKTNDKSINNAIYINKCLKVFGKCYLVNGIYYVTGSNANESIIKMPEGSILTSIKSPSGSNTNDLSDKIGIAALSDTVCDFIIQSTFGSNLFYLYIIANPNISGIHVIGSRVTVESVSVVKANIGIQTNSYLLNIRNTSVAYCNTGFYLLGNYKDGALVSQNTSILLEKCYALLCRDVGYHMEYIVYSNLISCACDGIGTWNFNKETFKAAYYLHYCDNVNLISCGSEQNIKMAYFSHCFLPQVFMYMTANYEEIVSKDPNYFKKYIDIQYSTGSINTSGEFSNKPTDKTAYIFIYDYDRDFLLTLNVAEEDITLSTSGELSDVINKMKNNIILRKKANNLRNSLIYKGTDKQRPDNSTISIGFQYYDTTLKKYIVWNGTEWTNMDGTALS